MHLSPSFFFLILFSALCPANFLQDRLPKSQDSFPSSECFFLSKEMFLSFLKALLFGVNDICQINCDPSEERAAWRGRSGTSLVRTLHFPIHYYPGISYGAATLVPQQFPFYHKKTLPSKNSHLMGILDQNAESQLKITLKIKIQVHEIPWNSHFTSKHPLVHLPCCSYPQKLSSHGNLGSKSWISAQN